MRRRHGVNRDMIAPTGTFGAFTGICCAQNQIAVVSGWMKGANHMIDTESVPLSIWPSCIRSVVLYQIFGAHRSKQTCALAT